MSDKLQQLNQGEPMTATATKTIAELMAEAHQTALEHGWWDGEERSVGDQFANFHAELSEAWEEYRKYGMRQTTAVDGNYLVDEPGYLYYLTKSGMTVTIPGHPNDINILHKPEGMAAELADTLIRIFDTCQRYQIPLVEALEVKMAYNKSRPYRHGGKKA